MADLYRKSLLEKLSSPDQLDRMVIVTPAPFWVALAAGALAVLCALWWSLCGSLPIKVEANGIFGADQNAYSLSSEVAGTVEVIDVSIGDQIEAGDTLYSLDAASLETEKAELEERYRIVEEITLESTRDIANSDTQNLLEIKRQISAAGSQVSQNETMLRVRETELEKAAVEADAAREAMESARLAVEAYERDNARIPEHYQAIKNAWQNVENYKAAMHASENVREQAKDDFEYYTFYQDSSDPEEQAMFQTAQSNYQSAESTYFSNKTQYETAIYAYNNFLESFYPDAQPSVSPEEQLPPLSESVNNYNRELSQLRQIYSDKQTDYNTAYSRQSSLMSEISSIRAQISAGEDGRGNSVELYRKQFEASKDAVLASLESEIRKYEKNIEKNVVTSPVSGIISDIQISVGNVVGQGSTSIVIRKNNDDDAIVACYIDLGSGKKVKPGMPVKIYPSTVNRQEYGNMEAVVVSVDDYVTTKSSIIQTLGDESLLSSFTQGGPVIGVKCSLIEDPSTASGYKWSSRKGAAITIEEGTLISADIITESKQPITMLIPYLKGKLNRIMNRKTEDNKANE